MTKRFVYFIEAGAGGHIKIGVTGNVASRLQAIQAANPAEIRLIAAVPGDHKDERQLHARFKDERLNGEWFRSDGAVRAFALSLASATPEECIAAVQHKEPAPKPPQPPKAAKPPKPPRPQKQRKAERRQYTRDEWNALWFVGEDGDVYRSTEAEELLANENKRRGLYGLQSVTAPVRRAA